MTDVLTKAQRSRNMAAIRSKNTKPEMLVRRILHRAGYRFRLHRTDIPGKPDLVFRGRRKLIFIHGCFWHSHNCRFGRVTPKSNSHFWSTKRAATITRDAATHARLTNAGWDVLTVWECELLDVTPLLKRFRRFLDRANRGTPKRRSRTT